jgi:hypothetical protein
MAAIAPAGFRPGWGPSRVGVEVAVSIPRSARLFTSLLALAACRQDDPGPLGPLDDLVGEVTSDGLVLRGADDTAFAGVSLEVPAGALPTGTAVTVSAVFDGTRLPAGAERVGAQFAVGLGGEVPSADLDLTLPVDAGLVDRFAQGEGDVKVWAREGAGWALVEPDATAPGRVTIPIGGDAVAAAGVKTVVRDASCGDGGGCAGTAADVFDPRACGDAGLCGEVRATGIETDGWALAVDAAGQNVVAVRPAVQAGSIMVIAVALDTGVVTEGPALGVSTADRLNPVSEGTSNTIVVGTGFGGNVSFSLEDHVANAETVHLYAVGAIRAADGAVRRLGVDGRTLFVDDGGRGEARIELEGEGRPSVVVPLDRPGQFAFGDGLVRIVDLDGKELERLAPPPGQEIPAFAPLAAQGDAVAVVTAPGRDPATARREAAGPGEEVPT